MLYSIKDYIVMQQQYEMQQLQIAIGHNTTSVSFIQITGMAIMWVVFPTNSKQSKVK